MKKTPEVKLAIFIATPILVAIANSSEGFVSTLAGIGGIAGFLWLFFNIFES